MSTVKNYQRIPTVGWTAIQQIKYLEALQRAALEDGIHLRTSSTVDALHVAPINCAPADDARDITHTFPKTDRATGYKADSTNLEPVHGARASTDPVDAGFKRALADGDLARSFRVWAHTFITKAMAVASGILAAPRETEADWVKPAARFANFQATSAAAGAQGVEENKSDDSKFDQLLAAMAKQAAQTEAVLAQMRDTQAQSQQAQTNLMQMMMIFAGQEQQRLTNEWATSSITSISASSGCAIEAAPHPQAPIQMPPALIQGGWVAGVLTKFNVTAHQSVITQKKMLIKRPPDLEKTCCLSFLSTFSKQG